MASSVAGPFSSFCARDWKCCCLFLQTQKLEEERRGNRRRRTRERDYSAEFTATRGGGTFGNGRRGEREAVEGGRGSNDSSSLHESWKERREREKQGGERYRENHYYSKRGRKGGTKVLLFCCYCTLLQLLLPLLLLSLFHWLLLLPGTCSPFCLLQRQWRLLLLVDWRHGAVGSKGGQRPHNPVLAA